jgi:hypothetical protein
MQWRMSPIRAVDRSFRAKVLDPRNFATKAQEFAARDPRLLDLCHDLRMCDLRARYALQVEGGGAHMAFSWLQVADEIVEACELFLNRQNEPAQPQQTKKRRPKLTLDQRDALERTARHEAGHILTAHFCGCEVALAEVRLDGSGVTRFGGDLHPADDLFVSVAGAVAEEDHGHHIYRNGIGHGSDWRRVQGALKRLRGYTVPRDELWSDPDVKSAMRNCWKFLRMNREVLGNLVDLLLDKCPNPATASELRAVCIRDPLWRPCDYDSGRWQPN